MYTLILAYITITSFISDDSKALSFTEDSTKSTKNVKWFHLKEIINCGRILNPFTTEARFYVLNATAFST